MFPIRDENPTLHTSFATIGIVVLNVLAWVFIQGLGFDPAISRSICKFGLIPGEILQTIPSGTRIQLSRTLACVVDGAPNWITLVSSMFLHGGWFHIIGNMWFLWVFGDNVEDSMGSVRFVLFYLLCGLAAAGAQMASNPQSSVPMVGASGAIGGVMGAYAVLYPFAPVHMLVFLGFFITRVAIPAIFILGYWFLLQVLGGVPTIGGSGGGVAFWAHIGGFVAGVILLPFFRSKKRVEERKRYLARRRRWW